MRRIKFGIAGRIARIRLDDAERMNRLDIHLCDELIEAFDRIAADGRVAAVTLTADGANFTAGGDIAIFRGAAEEVREGVWNTVGRATQVVQRMRSLDAVIVAGLQGYVAGGGLGIALASDVVIASDDVRLLPAHVALGAPADGGRSWLATRLMGSRQALDWMLSNRAMDADEALVKGLVTRVVPRDQLDDVVAGSAARLARGPRTAQSLIKQLVYGAETAPLAGHLDAERAAFMAVAGGAEFAEGVDAFVAKRSARFSEA